MRSTLLLFALGAAASLAGAAAAQQPAPADPGPVSGLSQADFGKLHQALRGEPQRPLKVRLQAALILGRSGGEAAVDPLAECLSDDPDYPVRAACALALGNVGDLHAIEPLVARLEDQEELVRAEAHHSLLRFTRPEAIPYLQTARERGSARVRLVLVDLAKRIKDPAAGVLLSELMGDADERVREQASAALKGLDSATVTVLLFRALDHPNYRVKASAAKAMGERQEKAAVERLIDLATSPLEAVEVQLAARAALRTLKPTYDVPALIALARDPKVEHRDRARALVLLAATGGPDALQACMELLTEDSMRIAAAQALAEMGDPRSLPALKDAAKKADDARVAKLMQIAIRKLERGSSN